MSCSAACCLLIHSTPTVWRWPRAAGPECEGTQVGGDWYDVIEIGAGRTALVPGDVMDRGVRAATAIGQIRATVRAYARRELRPVAVLEFLDATASDLGEDQIVTCVYAVYDPADRSLTYANACNSCSPFPASHDQCPLTRQ